MKRKYVPFQWAIVVWAKNCPIADIDKNKSKIGLSSMGKQSRQASVQHWAVNFKIICICFTSSMLNYSLHCFLSRNNIICSVPIWLYHMDYMVNSSRPNFRVISTNRSNNNVYAMINGTSTTEEQLTLPVTSTNSFFVCFSGTQTEIYHMNNGEWSLWLRLWHWLYYLLYRLH